MRLAPRSFGSWFVCSLLLAMATSAHVAQAAERYWQSPTGGSFHDSANWDVAAPTSADAAIFNLPSGTVSFASDTIVDQLRLAAPSAIDPVAAATFDFNGHKLAAIAAQVGAGSYGANLALQDGSLSATTLNVNDGGTLDIGAAATVFANDTSVNAGSTLKLTSDTSRLLTTNLAVAPGYAKLEFEKGEIEVRGGITNYVGIAGSDSAAPATFRLSGGAVANMPTHAAVGRNGKSVLDIVEGSQFTYGGELSIGEFISGSIPDSTVNVVGSGSKLVGAASYSQYRTGMLVGYSGGNGTLNVFDGAEVQATYVIVGGGNTASVGTATISGSNSKLVSTDRLILGSRGQADLTVENGATVAVTSPASDVTYGLLIGPSILNSANSTGSATIRGAGSTLINNRATVIGQYGQGTLLVESGAQVSNTMAMMAEYSTSEANVTVRGPGSKWTNSSNLTMTYKSSLSIEDGGEVAARLTTLVGDTSQRPAKLSVKGPDSKLAYSTFRLGTYSEKTQATIEVMNGGQISGGGFTLATGHQGTASMLVDGLNSKFDAGASFFLVLPMDRGTVDFSNGAELFAASLVVAKETPGATEARATLQQGAQAVISGKASVGLTRKHGGDLNIFSGSTLSSASSEILGFADNSANATVSGAGSKWETTGTMLLGYSDHITGSFLNLNDGGSASIGGQLTVRPNGRIALDGGSLKTNTLTAQGASSSITLTGSENVLELTGASSTFIGTVSGSGGLIKRGSGALTLSGANSFAGEAVVEEGQLIFGASTPTTKQAKVKGADLLLSDNAKISHSFAPSGSYAGFGSSTTNHLQSSATLLYGSNSSGSDTLASMQWRSRDEEGISDVLHLTGMVNNAAVDPHATDLFVLQMSYDESLLDLTESALVAAQGLFLGYFDETSGQWVNAVTANGPGSVAQFVGDTPWSTDYVTLGQWGVDTQANTVWAVLNHNSQFAAVPEPSSLTLLAIAAATTCAWRRRNAA